MAETFYSILGVETDAENEVIQRAYRDLVKETHPDVNDTSEATRQFKRITMARDVLIDESERDRYDRLGHDAYVKNHVGDSMWAVQTATADRPQAAGRATRRTYQDVTNRTASMGFGTQQAYAGTTGVNWSQQQGTAQGSAAGATRSRNPSSDRWTDGGHATESWQTASATYRRATVDIDTAPDSKLDVLIEWARSIGPWLFVHATLILSAVLTTWFLYLATPGASVSVTTLVAASLMIPLVISLSIFHILLTLYS